MEIYSTILARVHFGKLANINSFEDSIFVAILAAILMLAAIEDPQHPSLFLGSALRLERFMATCHVTADSYDERTSRELWVGSARMTGLVGAE